MKKNIALTAVIAMAIALTACANVNSGAENNDDEPQVTIDFSTVYAQPLDPASFEIPPLDLRGHELDHFETEQWFLQRINHHRENDGIHPYELYAPARVTAIEHSLDMRDNDFSSNIASDGRTHQQRHHRWFGYHRSKVTSSHVSSHHVGRTPEAFDQNAANNIIDRIMGRENTHNFLMNPTYYYIGIGFSIDENGRGRLCIAMATQDNQRIAHRARTVAEREAHRQAYLERVREERAWIEP